MQAINAAAQKDVRRGFGYVDNSSFAAFLSTPMRANIPKIESVTQGKKKGGGAPAASRGSTSYASYLKGLAVPQVEEDVGDSKGNCFYEVVAHKLYGDPGAYDVVRKFIMDVEERHQNLLVAYTFDEGIGDHIMAHREDGVWADQCEVFSAHIGYGFGLTVHERSASSPSGGAIRCSYSPLGSETRFLDISYLPELHYRSTTVAGGEHVPLLDTPPGVLEAQRLAELRALRAAGQGRIAVEYFEEVQDQDNLTTAMAATLAEAEAGAQLEADYDAVLAASRDEQQPNSDPVQDAALEAALAASL